MTSSLPATAQSPSMISNRTRSGWWYFGGGVLAAVIGLLPWLITGLRLPLQNLWAVETPAERMPIALLPFSQYKLSLMLALIIFGSALAGLFARTAPAGVRGRASLSSLAGVLLIFVGAGVQSTVVVYRGLADDPRSTIYLGAVIGVIVVGIVVGLIVLALLAMAPRAGASIGGTLAAIAAGLWLGSVIFADHQSGSVLINRWLGYSSWLPGILTGLTLAWCGLHSVGRAVAWFFDLLLLWIIPAGLTAMSYGAGSRVLAQDPAEMVSASLQVFRMALGTDGISLRLAGLAFVIGLIGVGLRSLRQRGRSR
ncbi:hypothetical protein FOE78_11170 [Microlunatus elymi]|uniref:Uncharacterized protein n=1 Tax=Microlunatus elymi TaxID=2596828 RepID=A0A516PZ04_9ACTN|nr:hypothetical protein [Microlunatus elymi]QDP96387.1 hypothetical protein FOE78_11170 [Microlunatus elymi]